MLLLTMDFIPVVQTEIRRTSETNSACSADPIHTTKVSRWSVWVQKLQGLMARLVDRGDTVAHRIAANDDTFHLPAELSPLFPMALLEQIFSVVISLVVIGYWLTG